MRNTSNVKRFYMEEFAQYEEMKQEKLEKILIGKDLVRAELKKLRDDEHYQFNKMMDLQLHELLVGYMEMEKNVKEM